MRLGIEIRNPNSNPFRGLTVNTIYMLGSGANSQYKRPNHPPVSVSGSGHIAALALSDRCRGGRRWALTGGGGMGRDGSGDRPGPRIKRPSEALDAHPMRVPHESVWVGFGLAG